MNETAVELCRHFPASIIDMTIKFSEDEM